MIISRAPLRISLGGGGTDLPTYYKKYGGFLIAGAINKHIYVGANQQFYNTYSLKYSKIEIAKKIDDINHPLIRESLRLLEVPPGIEITSLADVPSGTGLGSSGAFLVALLNTLHHYMGHNPTKRQIAEEACKIELDILKEPEGKQDKFVSAFGGIKAYEFSYNGFVNVIPLQNEDLISSMLKEKLLFFFTGERRQGKASDILRHHVKKMDENNVETYSSFNLIKNIGLKTKKAFEDLDFDMFGRLLDEHWEIKKEYSPESSNRFIDKCYKTAKKQGVLGGKIMGAGGGGFFMFYHPGSITSKWEFAEMMKRLGLHQVTFDFDNEGVTTLTKEKGI